jgi:hypothetical protein
LECLRDRASAGPPLKKVSPKGLASGMRMLTYFINRGGKGLTNERRAELEKRRIFCLRRFAKNDLPFQQVIYSA